MSHGGKRPGAGRKPLEKRETGACVQTASYHIDKLQPFAVTVLEEALNATHKVPRIVGRDAKGNPEYEYVEEPDHQVRVSAAKAILNKRIPDAQRTEVSGSPFSSNVFIQVVPERRKEIEAAAREEDEFLS